MIRLPPRSTRVRSSAASDVYKRQVQDPGLHLEESLDDFKRFDQRRLERITRWLGELRSWRNARVEPILDWTFTGADGIAHQLSVGDPWPSVDTVSYTHL